MGGDARAGRSAKLHHRFWRPPRPHRSRCPVFSERANDRFGSTVLRLADPSGTDGAGVVVTAPRRSTSDLMREAGAVYLLPEAMLVPELEPRNQCGAHVERSQSGARFGESVAVCPTWTMTASRSCWSGCPGTTTSPAAPNPYLAGANTHSERTYPGSATPAPPKTTSVDWRYRQAPRRYRLACIDVIATPLPHHRSPVRRW